MTAPRFALRLALVAGFLAVIVLAAELAVRVIDGYPLLATTLPARPPLLWRPPRELAAVAAQIGADRESDPAWIDQVPPRQDRVPDADLVALRNRPRWPNVQEWDLYNAWNRRWVQMNGCKDFVPVSFLPMPILVFDAPGGSLHPSYRFLPSRTTPMGLATNRYGWRGPDIPVDKPPNTIRVAFVGASTTVGTPVLPWSYPEIAVLFLNRWAERHRPDVRFDVVNAGRQGIVSTDIAAIARDEVAPMEPDFIVYYEGANQFFRAPLTTEGADATPSDKGRPSEGWQQWSATLAPHSALMRRLDKLAVVVATRNGREPRKPAYTLDWPASVDPSDPHVDSPDLPLFLPTIVGDLDEVHRVADAGGATMVMSSFEWLVSDGLQLDPITYAPIYQWLNERAWPYTYADLRRLVDFENEVFRRWTVDRRVPFVDVARQFPQDPALFLDAIHFDPDGTRVHAWIVFQQLLPLVRERLADHRLPRPDRTPATEHPNIGRLEELSLLCAKGPPPAAVASRP